VLASGDLEYSLQNKILNKVGTWFDGVFEDISIKAGNYSACSYKNSKSQCYFSVITKCLGRIFSLPNEKVCKT
jgi:hypothetical protein